MEHIKPHFRRENLIRAIVQAGLFAGTLDILAAFLSAWLRSATPPASVLRFVASGVFGAGAFSGSGLMAFYGLVFHYLIATTWAAIFFVAAGRFAFMVSQKWLSGVTFGCIVWLVMNQVVLPFSNTPKLPFNPGAAVIGTLILIGAIGIPVALMASRFYSGLKS